MKYKLLRDTPTHKAGVIVHQFSNNDKYFPATDYRNGYSKDIVENNPEWFEPVKEFKKKFTFPHTYTTNHGIDCYNNKILTETFATKEQAKAKKELMEHIFSFDEPKICGRHYEIVDTNTGGRLISVEQGNYGCKALDTYKYQAGYILNTNATQEDIEKRIELIKYYI